MPRTRRDALCEPRLDPIRLGPLSAGTTDRLVKGADLDGLSFSDIDTPALGVAGGVVQSCRFAGITADEADWKSTRLTESIFERLSVPVLRAPRGVWRDVHFDGARLGSLEAYETSWHAVQFVACKVDYVNLRAAEILDVLFTDCIVGEVDLVGATARRVAFDNTRVARLDLQHAKLEHVDLRGAELEEIDGLAGLRGATITPAQLALLAPLFAHEHGIRIQDAGDR